MDELIIFVDEWTLIIIDASYVCEQVGMRELQTTKCSSIRKLIVN